MNFISLKKLKGVKMNGFEQAQSEYESQLNAPYDVGGALYNYEDYIQDEEAYAEMRAEMMMDEIWSDF